jgi:hypothetical protein
MHSPEEFQRIRDHQANGMGGLPLVGDPDAVAQGLARLADLGLRGIAVSFVNYLDELSVFLRRGVAAPGPFRVARRPANARRRRAVRVLPTEVRGRRSTARYDDGRTANGS